MTSFGEVLRIYRRQCQDPLRGGLLTQERLGELLGQELGDAGYSGAAVSDWERNKSKINEDDRRVLVALIAVLHHTGSLGSAAEANALLHAGNYRALDESEIHRVFPEWIGEAPGKSSLMDHPTPAAAPQADSLSPKRRNQRLLLEKVKNFWVKGVLEQSVHEAMLLDIAYQRDDKAIDHPWREVVGADVFNSQHWSTRNPRPALLELFSDVDRALLILGEPGSGKTTTLLTLARDLITQAENKNDEPIPVILNLSSWVEQQVPLVDWVEEELITKYQIPSHMGREWLDNDELLLLLDGFDEVPGPQQISCGTAINEFRKRHGLTGIVVCSRVGAYNQETLRLKLGGAIRLQPLTQKQVELYLSVVQSDRLRLALAGDEILQEAARSPLMLNVMRLAYRDLPAALPESACTPDEGLGRQDLFTTYVDRMFQHRQADRNYSEALTKRWLSWLARQMAAHNQSVFFVEQLQPSWLPSRPWRWLYLLATRLVTGLYAGVIMWLLLPLLRQNVPEVPTELSDQMAIWLQLPPVWDELLAFVAANLFLALLVAIVHGIHFEHRLGREEPGRSRARQGWPQVATVGIIVGLVVTLVLLPYEEPLLALGWGIAEAVLFMIVSRFTDGRNYRNDVALVEALSWSPSSALKGLIFALLLAFLSEGIESWLYGYDGMSHTLLVMGTAGLILGGMRGRRLETKTRPNEGIWLSLKQAVMAALLSSICLGGLTWYLKGASSAMITVLPLILLVIPVYGGNNVSKHFWLRLLLWYKGLIPWRSVTFLDYAAGRVFLRKVGGGYMFAHRLLQEYFCEQNGAAQTASPAPDLPTITM